MATNMTCSFVLRCLFLGFICSVFAQVHQVTDENTGPAFILNSDLYLSGLVKRQDGLFGIFRAENSQLSTNLVFYVDFNTHEVVIRMRSRDSRSYKLTFPVQELQQMESFRLIIHLSKLGSTSNGLAIYINCELIERDNTEVPLREGLLGEPIITKDDAFNLYTSPSVEAVFNHQGCDVMPDRILTLPTPPDTDNIVNEVPLRPPPVSRNYYDGDDQSTRDRNRYNEVPVAVPQPDYHQFQTLATTMRDLGYTVRQLQREIQMQTTETRYLRETLRQCTMCRGPTTVLSQRDRRRELPLPPERTCALNPCFRGVRCVDTQRGFRCGACPRGYLGNGMRCELPPTCAIKPCFEGVTCEDTRAGYKCGPCPPGMTGDGRRGSCRVLRIGCEINPCFRGVDCEDTIEGYRCGPCPSGMTGDGRRRGCHVTRIGCETSPCFPEVECLDTLEGFNCGSCPRA